MTNFDDELRHAAGSLAREPLPSGLLDESLDTAAYERRWPALSLTVAAALFAVVAVIGLGRWLVPTALGPSPTVEASPTATVSMSLSVSPSPSVSMSPSPSVSPMPSSEPSPFAGTAAQLLVIGEEQIGKQVRVTGDVGIVAEGGPMLTLTAYGTGVGEFLVLIDTSVNDGQYTLDYVVGEPAEVEGTLLELTAENIDSVGNPRIDGTDVIDFIRGPEYLIVATSVVQR
jgi:hypothetical protein